jgi:hypothetical protein
LHLLPFGKYKIAYLHLLVKRKYKRKSRFFANTAVIPYKGLKKCFRFQIRPELRQRPRRPGSTHADQLGKRKAADLVGRSAALPKSQTLAGKSQSRSGESRGKVAKVVKVAQSSES